MRRCRNLASTSLFLKAILAWHLDSLSSAEVYCIQALNYSDLANNTNLRLTALNQYALISYYGKNFEQALSKSEEAYATLQKATREHIFPILQGRVYMYLAAFQAQQNIKQAEHTLERSCEAFATQIASSESVPLYADCGNASQLLWDGLTHYYLGQHNEKSKKHALISLQTSGQLLPNSAIPERFRLECLNNRTLAAIQLNDMEEAVTCFEAAGQGARALGSVQRVAEVDYVLFKMRKHWPKEVRVQELSDGSKETKGK